MPKASRRNRITPEEARRALYIDFEGSKDTAPVLLGCANRSGRAANPWVWQAVTDPLFEPLTKGDDHIELLSLADAVERILQRARAKERVIVAWSEHELNVVAKYCPQHLARFEERFVNARAVAVRWRNACQGGQKPETQRLADYLAVIGYEVAAGGGPGRAGETIAIVRKALGKKHGLKGLTENQLSRWRDLRTHNLHDCDGMKKVCVLAATELAARSALSASTPPVTPHSC